MFGNNYTMKPIAHRPGGLYCRLLFGNLEFSIVQHEHSYGGDRGLYEIGVFETNTGNGVEMPGITSEGDTVQGYLTEDDVAVIITKMTCATGENPVEIS